jgi:3',5'-cyclic AMP phosphodiesterase CpdA
MKIVVTSDLHYPTTTAETMRQFASKIASEHPAIIVLAGDLGETLVDFTNFPEAIRFIKDACPNTDVLVLAGNHDLWVPENPLIEDRDSRWLWETGLPEFTLAEDAHWLEGENFTKDGVCIVGSMLHYDYSVRDTTGPTAGLPTEYFITRKASIINDGRFLRGLPSDQEFAKTIGDAFQKRLQTAQDDPAVKVVVVVTHVPCVEELITRRPNQYAWACATPFFGNLSSETVIKSCSKVRYVISGHSHVDQRGQMKRADGSQVEFRTVASDYATPQYLAFDLP